MDDMSGMMNSSSMMNSTMMMMNMDMTFFSDTTTPLYSMHWQPMTSGQYAGTCIFLIFLSIISRLLTATRTFIESRWHQQALRRRYIVVADKQPLSERVISDPNGSQATLTTNGVDELVRVVQARPKMPVAWRFSVDLPRALLVTVQGGVMYLLMIAVMTMNVGYFISVLAGIFIGELAVGRYNHLNVEHNH
jgi:solute carrier family 31 (copper transporter), member 1